jgi:cytochrome c1
MRRLLFLGAALLATGCGGGAAVLVPGGNADAGPGWMKAYGCGGCHEIPGVDDATGRVGPSLAGLSDRRNIAGRLANTPENLERWIQEPQTVEPGTLMPDLGVSDHAAKDIAAYLYDH